jgi:uncharacterized protein YndB with AHSA1/START domain
VDADAPVAELRRRYAATPEKVFAAFADAALVAEWLRPAPEIRLTVEVFDFRVSGRYRLVYRLPDARTVCIGGAFRLIEPPSRIVFSWIIEPPDEHAGIDSEVTVIISPAGRGTELLVRHERLGRRDAVDRHAGGWRGAMELLARRLENRSAAS